jgi:hypothetical protein
MLPLPSVEYSTNYTLINFVPKLDGIRVHPHLNATTGK